MTLWFGKRNIVQQWYPKWLLPRLKGSGISTTHSGNRLLQPQNEPETKDAILANMKVLTLWYFSLPPTCHPNCSFSDRIQVKGTQHRITPTGLCSFLYDGKGSEENLLNRLQAPPGAVVPGSTCCGIAKTRQRNCKENHLLLSPWSSKSKGGNVYFKTKETNRPADDHTSSIHAVGPSLRNRHSLAFRPLSSGRT